MENGGLPNAPISPGALMYTYGTDEEFWEIVADLEVEFGVTFDADEVMDMGEMTVRSFIELVVKKVEQKEDQDV